MFLEGSGGSDKFMAAGPLLMCCMQARAGKRLGLSGRGVGRSDGCLSVTHHRLVLPLSEALAVWGTD